MKKYCTSCKEDSMVVKVYRRLSDNKKRRVQVCINKICGKVIDLPFVEDL